MLYAYEIYDLGLKRLRLVVLASCSSGMGGSSTSEGVLSLARPFLAAGAAVVASLWAAADSSASQLLIAFHRHVRHGEDPPEALRHAQADLMNSSDQDLRQPAAWAAFEVFGDGGPIAEKSRQVSVNQDGAAFH